MEYEYSLLDKLSKSDLSIKSNQQHYSFIYRNYIPKTSHTTYKHHIQEIEEITNQSSKIEKIKMHQLQLKEKLRKELDGYISLIYNFSGLRDKIKYLYALIVDEILKKETLINSFLDYYAEFKLTNKNNIIRYDILGALLKKISFSNSEKEILLTKTTVDQAFFELLRRIIELSDNVKLISDNSSQFSKSLVLSLKENLNVIRELANEKIIYYVKNLFINAKNQISHISQSNHSKLSLTPSKSSSSGDLSLLSKGQGSKTTELMNLETLNNLIISLKFIQDNTNFIVFIQKEYINFRKKVIEENYRFKKFKFSMTSVDYFIKVFLTITRQFEFLFLREALLMYLFFYESKIFYKKELTDIVEYINLSIDKKIAEVEEKNYEGCLNDMNKKPMENSSHTDTKEESIVASDASLSPYYSMVFNMELTDKYNFFKCSDLNSVFLQEEISNLYILIKRVNSTHHSSKRSQPSQEQPQTQNSSNEKGSIQSKDNEDSIFKNFINGLNTIFYHFLYELYETFNFIKNSLEETEKNVSAIFKLCILLKFIMFRLEAIFNTIGLKSQDYKGFELFSLIMNYQHKFSKSYMKVIADITKKISKFKQTYIKELSSFNKTGNFSYLAEMKSWISELAKILEINEFFKTTLGYNPDKREGGGSSNNNNEILAIENTLRSLIEFFDEVAMSELLKEKYTYNNINQIIAVKIVDYQVQIRSVFSGLKEVAGGLYKQIEDKISANLSIIESFFVKNILEMTSFEDSLVKIISQEHAVLFMEKLSDTCNYMTIALLDHLTYYELKEKIKESIKQELLKEFKEIVKTNEECLYILGEEDFKGFLSN